MYDRTCPLSTLIWLAFEVSKDLSIVPNKVTSQLVTPSWKTASATGGSFRHLILLC